MKHEPYEETEVLGLLPLLDSIGREIQERTDRLAVIESRIEALSQGGRERATDRLHSLTAEAAAHRRGIRLARKELEGLGCSVVGTTPLTFRIPGRVGEAKTSFVWQAGDPVLR